MEPDLSKGVIITGATRGAGGVTPPGQEVNDFHARSDVDASRYAQHHTLGLKHNQASPGDHTHDGINSKLLTPSEPPPAGGTTFLTTLLAAQLALSANNTLVNVPGFVIPMEANAQYIFRMYLIMGTSVVSDLAWKSGWTLPAGATVKYINDAAGTFSFAPASTTLYMNRQSTVVATISPFNALFLAGDSDTVALPVGMIKCGATPGNAQFRMAKSTATAGNVLLRADSWIESRKV